MTANSRRFFANRNCEYFPCHDAPGPDDFNCLFCFCPLYHLGSDCGGDFQYTAKGKKTCVNCVKPHQPDYYDEVLRRLREAAK